MSVRETLRERFDTLADRQGVDTADVSIEPADSTGLRIDAPGIEPTDVWGNSGVRDVLDAIADGGEAGDATGSQTSADRRREAVDEAATTLDEVPVYFSGEEPTGDELAELAEVGLASDRVFIAGKGDSQKNLTLYETAALEESQFTVSVDPTDTPNPVFRIVDALQTLPAQDVEGAGASLFGSTDREIAEAAADREVRRETRDAAREAAEAAGVDLNEFGIGARADGEVIVQDRDTGRTRTVDADAPGGVGSAIDAATGEGQFVADDADPAASGSGSGDGLGARAAGAIVLLFGAIAAALGWLS